MLKRLGLCGLAAALACGLLACPAQAMSVRTPLACSVMHGVILTNDSNYYVRKGATLDVVVTSGRYTQHFSRQLTAPLPIGATINYGPVLLVVDPSSPSTCIAIAIWRVPPFFKR